MDEQDKQLCERFENLCIDYAGESIRDDSSTRDPVSCKEARQAAATIRRLSGEVEDLESTCSKLMDVDADTMENYLQIENQLKEARELLKACVEEYPVASGEMIIDGEDGYGSLKAARAFLSRTQPVTNPEEEKADA